MVSGPTHLKKKQIGNKKLKIYLCKIFNIVVVALEYMGGQHSNNMKKYRCVIKVIFNELV